MANLHTIRCRGFTLLEMLVVCAIVALGALMADRWLSPTLQKNRVSAAAANLLAALNLARSEAILRNLPVSLCPSRMHETGAARCEGAFHQGWIVFANPGRDSAFDGDDDTVLRVYPALSPGVTLSNRTGTRRVENAIHFLPSGASHRNQTLLFCSTAARRAGDISIVMNILGRPRLERNWGVCPAAQV